MCHFDFNAPQKPFGKNLVLLKVVFPEPLLTNRGQRNTKNENPSPFLWGHLSLFIICKRVWHFVQYNVSYHRSIY